MLLESGNARLAKGWTSVSLWQLSYDAANHVPVSPGILEPVAEGRWAETARGVAGSHEVEAEKLP